MATDEQRARRRAQRATAARLKSGKYVPVIPRSTRAAVRAGMEHFGDRVLSGQEPMPEKGTAASKVLASLASLARWGKADAKYLAFKDHWYHKNDEKNDADIEDESSGPDNDEDNQGTD